MCAPHGKFRQAVSAASDGAQRLVGRFLQPSQRIGCKPAPALSFLSWPFFVSPGCKPANRVRTKVRTFRVAVIPHRRALTGLSARLPTLPGANRKPCKPCFLARRWRDAALAPSVLEYRQEGPLLPGAHVRAPTITIGGDHHYRHNHHGSVTARDDGDGCDGRRLSFIQAKAQISPGGPTITLRRAPASTPGCHAGREVRARRRCDRGARRRTRGMGNASAARRAGRAS